tara:strand:+ start:1078 stop:1641 length:564 start_codon:yes stop_codon:yes gene_type:complete
MNKEFKIKKMKNITLLLSLLMIASCSQPNEEVTKEEQSSITEKVTVTAVESDLKCHMCPGFILIQKGDKIDTMKTGSWGKPSDHIYFQKDNRHYIAFPGGYFSGGTSETSIKILSVNEDDYLEAVFDTAVSDRYSGNLELRLRSFDFYPPDTLLFKGHTELYNEQDESKVIKDSISELVIIDLNLKE